MSPTQFMARERKREWMFRLQVVSFSLIMGSAFFLFVALMFQLDTLLGGL